MSAAAAALDTWIAPPHWRAIDFLSDLHLSNALPRTLAAFEQVLLHSQADALCLLGDVFEAWVGDDAATLPFEARVTQALRAAAQRRPLMFMAGNRDFLLGEAFCRATGMQPLADPCTLQAWGQRWLLSHGDAQCLADAEYQAFRTQVRQPAWQQAFLAQPLAERVALAQAMRQRSMQRHAQRPAQGHGGAVESLGDLDADCCRQQLRAAGARTLIHGHTHRPADHDLGEGMQRVVLSDWDADHDGAARAEVLRLSADGRWHRLRPEQACAAA